MKNLQDYIDNLFEKGLVVHEDLGQNFNLCLDPTHIISYESVKFGTLNIPPFDVQNKSTGGRRIVSKIIQVSNYLSSVNGVFPGSTHIVTNRTVANFIVEDIGTPGAIDISNTLVPELNSHYLIKVGTLLNSIQLYIDPRLSEYSDNRICCFNYLKDGSDPLTFFVKT